MVERKRSKIHGFVLEEEAIAQIRKTLLIGLAHYGELERVDETQSGIYPHLERMGVPAQMLKDMRVVGQAGAFPGGAGEFAEALLALEFAPTLENEVALLRKFGKIEEETEPA